LLDEVAIMHQSMLAWKGKAIGTHAMFLEDDAMGVETSEGLFSGTQRRLVQARATDYVTEVEESANAFHHSAGDVPSYCWKVNLEIKVKYISKIDRMLRRLSHADSGSPSLRL